MRLNIINIAALVLMAVVFVTPGIAAGTEITSEDLNPTYKNYTHSDVKVLLTLSNYFEITLPTGFTFADGNKDGVYTASDLVKLDVGRLNTTEYVDITMKSNNYTINDDRYWNLTNSENNVEYYQVGLSEGKDIHLESVDNRLVSGDSVLKNATSDSNYIHMRLVNNADNLVETGVFTDILTFEVRVKETTDSNPFDDYIATN